DTTPPETVITAGPTEGSVITNRYPTVCWSGSDNGTWPSNLVYAYKLDTNVPSAFVTNTCVTFTNLADGPHQVSVQAQDLRGNIDPTPAVRHFSIDATPPTITNVVFSPGLTQCVVAWTTDELAKSQLEYGLTPAYGLWTPLDLSPLTNH